MTLAPTPGQTIGPFFHYALPFDRSAELVPSSHPDRVRLHGLVVDGAGHPVPDALVEVWQADPAGRVPQTPGSLRRDGWTFTGWGRASTDRTGRYSFSTLAPGAVTPGSAAYFSLCIFGRGILDRLLTRAYLPANGPDEHAALVADPLLRSVAADRRDTLVARRDDDGYIFDVNLQGDNETVFLSHGAR